MGRVYHNSLPITVKFSSVLKGLTISGEKKSSKKFCHPLRKKSALTSVLCLFYDIVNAIKVIAQNYANVFNEPYYFLVFKLNQNYFT